MHYIRLMRPPTLDSQQRLKLVLTITTDLGDSFLCPHDPVPISVHLTGSSAADQDRGTCYKTLCLTSRTPGNSAAFWKGGMRILKMDLPVPDSAFKTVQELASQQKPPPAICVAASHDLSGPPSAADIPFDAEGRIVAVESEFPWPPGAQRTFESRRRFALAGRGFLRVDERIGESIDRHVWDAGVVTAGVLLNICQDGGAAHTWDKTPILRELLCSVTPTRPLSVIELGCGVGILGIGLAAGLHRRMSSSWDPGDRTHSSSSILLTDLPDAEDVAVSNIAHEKQARKPVASGKSSVDTRFETLDWDEGKSGVFGTRAKASSWDLIIISDCTYNVDMLSALVNTISELHRLSVEKDDKSPRVVLATKPRHSSEEALFGLMDKKGWRILESAIQSLPVLGLEHQTVEIYLFGKCSD